MSAKKLLKVTIIMGLNKGKEATITKKKAPEGFVVINIIDGEEMTIHKTLIK